MPKQLPPPRDACLASSAAQSLSARLPQGWAIAEVARTRPGLVDTLEVRSPDGTGVVLAFEIRSDLPPRDAAAAAQRARDRANSFSPRAVPIVIARFLSPRTRQLLDECGVNYVDTTGNVRVSVGSPGLFIATQGASRDPAPTTSTRSLRGRAAGRAMRAILDRAPPFGVRELAAATGASAPTISRVLELLDHDGWIIRDARGPVREVDWNGAIRRWAQDYDQVRSNTRTLFLEPRGLTAVARKLEETTWRYAATGAFAAQRFGSVMAPARMAALYVEDAASAADRLGFRETDGDGSGANVMLLEPFDPVVFDRVSTRKGLVCVAPTQLAVDLLTGPGREPSQGEELVRWMEDNLVAWRR